MALTESHKRPDKHSHYLKVSISLLVIIGISGWLLNSWMIKSVTPNLTVKPVGIPVSNELDTNFSKAVSLMQQREYAQASLVWEQILLSNSTIPEVNVNMGFSLYELGKYEAARDFFITAMEQNSFQANAYYGLAISSERIGDIKGAMGAMKSYIHLAQNEQNVSYLRKARSAVWEWETQLSELREQKESISAELPESD